MEMHSGEVWAGQTATAVARLADMAVAVTAAAADLAATSVEQQELEVMARAPVTAMR